MRYVAHLERVLGRAFGSALVAFYALAVLTVGAQPAVARGAPVDWLQVSAEDGTPLVSLPMPKDAGWCLAWNHSVEGFKVLDCYRNVDGNMVLERSHLPDFAAGLDHVLGRGRQVSDGESGYWIEDIDEPVPDNRYRLRVGAMRVDHRLVSRGEPTLESLIESRRQACDERLPDSLPEAMTPISLSALAANRAVTVTLLPCTSGQDPCCIP